MIKRIYAANLMGISDADLGRLEVEEKERDMLIAAEQLAEEYGVELDQALRDLQEICERIERWGLQPELRRLAQELGMSEERVRALHEAEMEKYAL